MTDTDPLPPFLAAAARDIGQAIARGLEVMADALHLAPIAVTDDCPASKSGRCLQPSGGLSECAEGECDWEVYNRAFPPAPADAAPPRRSTRKPKRGPLPAGDL